MVEYGITLGGVAAVSYLAIVVLGDKTGDLYAWMANHMPGGESGETAQAPRRSRRPGRHRYADQCRRRCGRSLRGPHRQRCKPDRGLDAQRHAGYVLVLLVCRRRLKRRPIARAAPGADRPRRGGWSNIEVRLQRLLARLRAGSRSAAFCISASRGESLQGDCHLVVQSRSPGACRAAAFPGAHEHVRPVLSKRPVRAVACRGAVSDYRRHRIPNLYLLIALVYGLACPRSSPGTWPALRARQPRFLAVRHVHRLVPAVLSLPCAAGRRGRCQIHDGDRLLPRADCTAFALLNGARAPGGCGRWCCRGATAGLQACSATSA